MNYRHFGRFVFIIVATVAIAACSGKKSAPEEKAAEQAAPLEPNAPAIVVAMIDAHGGMAAWRSAKTVAFESEFSGPGDSAATTLRVTVDQERRRAYADVVGTDQSLAWDGKRAWSMNWTMPYPPRFIALLDYYFLDLPWLTMDPGVKLADAGRDSLWGGPTEYRVVDMSFMPGTGDTPRDTYRLYIDPDTKRLRACRYSVTYRSLVPDSMDAMPAHILEYEDFTKVNGLTVPSRYTVYRLDHSPIGTCVVRDWSFDRPFDEARMTMPDSAVVDQSKP